MAWLSIFYATGNCDAGDAFSPYNVGILGQMIVRAVNDLGLEIDLQFEAYEQLTGYSVTR